MDPQREIAIKVEGLWKYYGLPPLRYSDILRHWWNILRYGRQHSRSSIQPPDPHILWALQDISFELYRGQSLGIIGLNGSGKSTLLKVLAGTTPPNYGSVEVHGKLFSMIELSAGMNPELTGRENCKLLGAVMGLTPKEINEHVPAIEEFCELGEWFDRPIRTYSSGMHARLGFGVAINVEADILLIDEVLAVGDISFQKKCIDALTRLKDDKTSLVFVSHSPYQVERVCDYALFLETGRVKEIAESQRVVSTYLSMVTERQRQTAQATISEDKRDGTGDLRVTKVEIVDKNGRVRDTVDTGDTITINVYFCAYKKVVDPLFRIFVVDDQNTFVLMLNSTRLLRGKILEGDGMLQCCVEDLPLMPKNYVLQVKITGEGNLLVDIHYNAYNFHVNASPEILEKTDNRGIAYAKNTWKLSNNISEQYDYAEN